MICVSAAAKHSLQRQNQPLPIFFGPGYLVCEFSKAKYVLLYRSDCHRVLIVSRGRTNHKS